MSPTVIVFGPTGSVASITARTAQSHGAKVILAMRDPSKSIPGLTKEQEQQGGYSRVQADLTKPETLTTAVKSSGATRAFVYLAHGSPDHMKSSLEALKSAGIEFVVFLSSYTIGSQGGDPKKVVGSEIIPYMHAQVEISLNEVFGPEKFVAIRAGAFATNLLRYKDGILKGDLRLFGGDFKMDYITPVDMGTVSGTILATQTGPREGQGSVYLFGPQVLPIADAIAVVGKVLEKEFKVTHIDEKEATEQFEAMHFPKPLTDYMIRKFGEELDEKKERPWYDEGVENVRLYTGKPATALREWAEANKELFSA